MSNIAKYETCFIEIFEVSKESLETLEYQSVSGWDSVGHMNLMTVIEEEFNIEMDIDDITDFSSFAKGKEIIAKYGVNFDE